MTLRDARRAHLLTAQSVDACTLGDELSTTSRQVAAVFGKRHTHVLRAIRELLDQLPVDDHALNFEPMIVEVDIAKGATRRDPAYRISRDGFGKQHYNVMRAIRALLEQMPPEDHASHFGLMLFDVEIGGGASRRDPAYRVNFAPVPNFGEANRWT